MFKLVFDIVIEICLMKSYPCCCHVNFKSSEAKSRCLNKILNRVQNSPSISQCNCEESNEQFLFRRLDKPECRKCAKALQELENIDDEADQLGIGFVKIHDETLADEYNLGELPRLVYYRHKTPIIYESMYTSCRCQEIERKNIPRLISHRVAFINFFPLALIW